MSLEISYSVYEAANLSKEVIANEQRWKSLLENVQFLVCGVNKDGMIYYANPVLFKNHGFRNEEIINKHFNFLVSPKAKATIENLGETFQKR